MTQSTHSFAIQSERLLLTFVELARLDSPSRAEDPVRQYLLKQFADLNLPVDQDSYGNLLIHWPGHEPATKDWYVVTAHMDVVPPCLSVQPVVEGSNGDRVIRSDGTTVLGADDKSALASILEAIRVSQTEQTQRPNILFLITVEEEIGLRGATAMDPTLYQHAKFAIAFDHSGPQGLIINEAPTLTEFKLTVYGHSVHAGICPERGSNAIQQLSQLIKQCPGGRIDESTTFNWARIEGGKGTNVVPDRAEADGEFRSRNPEQIAHFKAELTRLAASVEKTDTQARAEVTFDDQLHHYYTDPAHPAFEQLCDAIKDAGCTPQIQPSNGASDINVFANNGLPGVVLSAGYIDPHNVTEHVYLKDMETMTRILLLTWERWANGH